MKRAAALLALCLAVALPIGRAPDAQPAQGPAQGPAPRSTAPADAAPPAEQVVAGLSQDAVSITTNFTGSQILIYGAVKREAPLPAGPPLNVVVTVEGPARPVKIRRKERRLGIWMNAESLTVGAAPDFYVVATSAPLDQMLSPDEDTRFRISIPLAVRAFGGPIEVDDVERFTGALLRLRKAAGRYRLDQGSVRIVDQTLFRADVTLPANLIEGQYKTSIFLVRDGRVVSVHRAPIRVEKVGLERWLYRLALDRPFWYGLLSLAIAVAAGWAASAAFRALRRP